MHDFLSIQLVPDLQPQRICSTPKPSRFPGSIVFCKATKRSHSHLYRVLTGERVSPLLVNEYAAFLTANKLPWPATAKVKPTKTAA